MLSSIFKNWGHLQFSKNWGRLPISKSWCYLPFSKFDVVFRFQQNWVCLSFSNIKVVFHLKKMRSSSIFKNIEAVFHISSYWVKIRLYTKNQLPRFLINALIVISPSVVVVCCFILTDTDTTPTKVVLSCLGCAILYYIIYTIIYMTI